MVQSDTEQFKPHRSFPLRLSPSLRQMAYEVAKAEGISLNHFICIAVAERLSRLERDFLNINRSQAQSRNGTDAGFTRSGKPGEKVPLY
jgi:hypothetical protein